MIAHGPNILAANIATAVFIIILLFAFWPRDDKDQEPSETECKEEKGKVKE